LKSKKGTKRAQDFEVEDLLEAKSEEVEKDIMENSFDDQMSRYYQQQFNETPQSSPIRNAMVSQNMTSILDRNNFSGRKSVMLMGVIARETGADLNSNLASTSTLERLKNRVEIPTAIREKVSIWEAEILVVHWDGKKLANSTDPDDFKRKVERHAVVVSGCTPKILKVKNANLKIF
jgi:hypothetical protein